MTTPSPSIGRIVHYCYDPSGRVMAAIVTEVVSDTDVLLTCFPPGGFSGPLVGDDDAPMPIPYATGPMFGHWSWPPRA